MANHQSIKNKYSECNRGRQQMPIGEYIRICQEYDNLPGRIHKPGVMEILFMGQWITKQELDKLFPKPVVISFNFDASNCDKTRSYLLA